jgi:MoaA/NifB/PqqE/SkfB family radical SAM enzyme
MQTDKYVFLTYKCNNNCRFCSAGILKDNIYHEPETEYVFRRTKEIRKSTDEVVLTGGEPTIHKDFFKILNFTKRLDFRTIQIQTNGRMFSYKEFARKAGGKGIEFMVSLYGPEKVHDYLTRVPDSFNQTVKGIENLKKENQYVIGNVVVTKENYRHLPYLVELLVKLKVDRIQLCFVEPVGYAFVDDKIIPTLTEVCEHTHNAMERAENTGVILTTEGFPLCFMRGCESHASGIQSEEKVKSYMCKECKDLTVCEGIWKYYAMKYGFNELRPKK